MSKKKSRAGWVEGNGEVGGKYEGTMDEASLVQLARTDGGQDRHVKSTSVHKFPRLKKIARIYLFIHF